MLYSFALWTKRPEAERIVRSSPDRAVRARALAGDIVLCSWARHFILTVPLSTQEYKWVLANCWGNLTNCWRVTCDELVSRPGGLEILLAASCYRNRDKLRQLWAGLGYKASLLLLSCNAADWKVSELHVAELASVQFKPTDLFKNAADVSSFNLNQLICSKCSINGES